jgi:hypothetical protein
MGSHAISFAITGSMNSGSFFTNLISNDGTYLEDYAVDHSD